MKLKQVKPKIIEYSVKKLKSNLFYRDEKVILKSINQTAVEASDLIDREMKGVYKTSRNHKLELGIVVLIFGLVAFLSPLNLLYRIGVGLFACIVFEFIKTKGFKYTFKEVIGNAILGEDLEIHYKPKLGHYIPILIGTGEDGRIHVFSGEKKNDLSNISRTKMYIADKEILPEMIHMFIDDNPTDINSVAEKIKVELEKNYNKIYYVNSNKDRIEDSNSFN
ncbi:hypothetical protein D3C81_674730 [compost metagenome]